MAFLEIKNVNKAFKTNQALSDFSFSLEKGKTISLIGDSGSGKTTFLRILNFLDTMDSGEIYLDGSLINDGSKKSRKVIAERQQNFGLVFQSFNLFPQYKARRNIFMPLELKLKKEAKEASKGQKGLDKKAYYQKRLAEETERVNRYIEEFRLESKLESYPAQLSGGEKQRVAIIRALALSPKVLCFDEPTSALDPSLKNEVSNAIFKLKETGITMLVVTHEMTLANKISDVVVFMKRGIIVEKGEREILASPKTTELQEFLTSEHQSQ